MRRAAIPLVVVATTVLALAGCTGRGAGVTASVERSDTAARTDEVAAAAPSPEARPQADPAAPPASPCADAPVVAYADVDRRSPHAAAVDCTRWLEVVRGVDPEVFAPAADVRRDQMAALVARSVVAAGGALPPPDRDAFRDLEGNVHRDAIGSLAAAGIVGGYDDGTYRPRGVVPRGQMTAFLARAHEHLTGTPVEDPPDAFRDDDGHPHEPTIDALAALGIASGRADGTFGPDAAATRAELASFLVRLVGSAWPDGRAPAPSAYRSEVAPLHPAVRQRMTGVSWRPGCPVGLDDLRLVQLVHRGMDGRDRWGLVVVRAAVADDVAAAFAAGYADAFPIERMELVDRYGADDDASMAANNTSGFNCRVVAGTTRWSQHAYGLAVDVNPVQNPYVQGDRVDPPAGRAYLDRSDVRPGMLVRPNPLLSAFAERGWSWGGDWRHPDYQHLSTSGR